MLRETKNKGNAGQDPQETAAAILGWLANEPDMLSRFLALSGLQANMLRQAVNDPGFLAGLTDFLMSHEPDLMAFCAATDTPPKRWPPPGTIFPGRDWIQVCIDGTPLERPPQPEYGWLRSGFVFDPCPRRTAMIPVFAATAWLASQKG